MDTALVWFLVGLVLILLEIAVPGVILVFLGVAAWIVAGLDLLGVNSLTAQLWIFAGASVALLFGLRRFVKSWFLGRATNDSDDLMDEFVGKSVVVLEAIEPGGYGQVELKGAQWKATSTAAIAKDARCEVEKVDGLCLHVRPLSK